MTIKEIVNELPEKLIPLLDSITYDGDDLSFSLSFFYDYDGDNTNLVANLYFNEYKELDYFSFELKHYGKTPITDTISHIIYENDYRMINQILGAFNAI